MSSLSIKSKFPTTKKIIATVASVAATVLVVRNFAKEYLPPEFQSYVYVGVRKFIINRFSTHLTMVIYESEGFRDNEIYNAAELYIAAKMSAEIHRVKVIKNRKQKNIAVTMDINQEFTDVYKGVKFHWLAKKKPRMQYNNGGSRSDKRYLELTFHRDYKDMVVNDYFPFMIKDAEMKKLAQKNAKLFTVNTWNSKLAWRSVNLDHPATFETLAMDVDTKEMVMKDLDRFVERREYYRKVGRAWKRGYLLYGPPGTGKSSLIAAMANYLHFDIYDLELTDVRTNSELRMLLTATGNRSILVVEDIDCSVELHDRLTTIEAERPKDKKNITEDKKVTLSGFLNFIDGLWSSCGDERIIIFTTNHKDKLDPAIIRPGRMDVHILMSYCTPCGFRLLVSNYLGITQHNLFNQIEDLMLKINVTPAEVAEQLLKHDDPDLVLDGLIKFFEEKRKENEEAKAAIKNRESEHSETVLC